MKCPCTITDSGLLTTFCCYLLPCKNLVPESRVAGSGELWCGDFFWVLTTKFLGCYFCLYLMSLKQAFQPCSILLAGNDSVNDDHSWDKSSLETTGPWFLTSFINRQRIFLKFKLSEVITWLSLKYRNIWIISRCHTLWAQGRVKVVCGTWDRRTGTFDRSGDPWLNSCRK